MERFLATQPGWLLLWLAVLAVLLFVAYYVIAKLRPKREADEQDEPLASQWLTKYRDLHDQGVLSDEEFRTIKQSLLKQMQQELKDNGETGSNE